MTDPTGPQSEQPPQQNDSSAQPTAPVNPPPAYEGAPYVAPAAPQYETAPYPPYPPVPPASEAPAAPPAAVPPTYAPPVCGAPAEYAAPAPYGAPAAPAYGAPSTAGYGAAYAAAPTPGVPPVAPYAYGAYPARKTNGLAVASLILSIVGFLWLLPLIGSLAGAIMGHIALGQIKRTGESGRGMALAGVIIGWAGVALVVLGVVLLFVIIAASAGSSSQYS